MYLSQQHCEYLWMGNAIKNGAILCVCNKQAPPTLIAISCKGVWWLELTNSGSAPNLNSFITVEKSPLRAAMCSALQIYNNDKLQLITLSDHWTVGE